MAGECRGQHVCRYYKPLLAVLVVFGDQGNDVADSGYLTKSVVLSGTILSRFARLSLMEIALLVFLDAHLAERGPQSSRQGVMVFHRKRRQG